jgi:hypothetical protein
LLDLSFFVTALCSGSCELGLVRLELMGNGLYIRFFNIFLKKSTSW